MRQAFLPYAIAFRAPVRTGAGDWVTRRGAWLRLEDDDGRVGLGESAPLQPLASARDAAEAVAKPPYSDAALDLARLDLEAQRRGVPIAGLLGTRAAKAVACNALCFAPGIDEAGAEAVAAVAAGFATLKLKVGAADPGHDIERVAEIRRRVGPVPRLRLDANGAWDDATARRVLRAVAPLGIEFVEDPVAGEAGGFRDDSGVALAADVRSLDEGWRVVRGRRAAVLVLKPMALGGIGPARPLACAAVEAGLAVVVTSVFDTAVGIAGALHLAASLPGPAQAHGLATAVLLEPAPLVGLVDPAGGMLRVPDGPGLGVRLA